MYFHDRDTHVSFALDFEERERGLLSYDDLVIAFIKAAYELAANPKLKALYEGLNNKHDRLVLAYQGDRISTGLASLFVKKSAGPRDILVDVESINGRRCCLRLRGGEAWWIPENTLILSPPRDLTISMEYYRDAGGKFGSLMCRVGDILDEMERARGPEKNAWVLCFRGSDYFLLNFNAYPPKEGEKPVPIPPPGTRKGMEQVVGVVSPAGQKELNELTSMAVDSVMEGINYGQKGKWYDLLVVPFQAGSAE